MKDVYSKKGFKGFWNILGVLNKFTSINSKGALDNPAGGEIQFLNYWNEIVKHGSN